MRICEIDFPEALLGAGTETPAPANTARLPPFWDCRQGYRPLRGDAADADTRLYETQSTRRDSGRIRRGVR
jgi:hypothetical protein